MVEVLGPAVLGRAGRCRLCARETVDGQEVAPGRRFTSAAEVEAALRAWADDEGEPEVERFVVANFRAGTVAAVAAGVLERRRTETSFDVVAWLFRDRTGGQSVLGGADGTGLPADDGPPTLAHGPLNGVPAPAPHAGRPGPERAATADGSPSVAGAEPRASTIALVTVAMADGAVPDVERAAVLRELAALGAPAPEPGDWRLWRPAEAGLPPDPRATVAAMRRVALVTRLPDPSCARVIREFARAWRVSVPDVVLPPVTTGQRLADGWMRFFGR